MVDTTVWARVDTVRSVYRHRGGVQTVGTVDTVRSVYRHRGGVETVGTVDTVRIV